MSGIVSLLSLAPFAALDVLSARNVVAKLYNLERTQWLDPKQLQNLQLARLRKLIGHAARNCPFYERLLHDRGIDPEAFRSLSDLRQLPVVTKEMVRNNLEDMRSRAFDGKNLLKSATGGSTGVPMPFYYTAWHNSWRCATANRLFRMAGRHTFTRTLNMAGTSIDYDPYQTWKERAKSFVRRETRAPAFDLTRGKVRALLDTANRARPRFLLGYASALRLLARVAIEESVSLDIPRVMPIAELVTDSDRDLFRDAFKADTFVLYGSREMTGIAGECDAHQGLHVSSDVIFMEICRDGEPVAPGEAGEIVLTDLMNFGMPLIRYAIGDVGRFTGESCSCGRGLPLMEICHGRISDVIVLPSGKILPDLYFPHLFKEVWREVKEYQVVQEAIDRFRIAVAPTAAWSDDTKAYLLQHVREKMGAGVKLRLETVAQIPREASGKFRTVKSNVDGVASWRRASNEEKE